MAMGGIPNSLFSDFSHRWPGIEHTWPSVDSVELTWPFVRCNGALVRVTVKIQTGSGRVQKLLTPMYPAFDFLEILELPARLPGFLNFLVTLLNS